MTNPVTTNTFVNGTLADADEVNTNFTQAATQVSNVTSGHSHDGTDSRVIGIIYTDAESASEDTITSGTGWVDIKEFTLDPVSLFNSLVGMEVTLSAYWNSSSSSTFRIRVLVTDESDNILYNFASSWGIKNTYITTTKAYSFGFFTAYNQASYKFKLQMDVDDGNFNYKMKDVTLKVAYNDEVPDLDTLVAS